MRNSFQSRCLDDGWFQVLPGLILELLGSVSWTMDRGFPRAREGRPFREDCPLLRPGLSTVGVTRREARAGPWVAPLGRPPRPCVLLRQVVAVDPLAVGATGLVVERLVGFAHLLARAGRDRPLVALAFLGRGQKFGCGRWSRCRRHGGGRC